MDSWMRKTDLRKSELTPARRQLVELCARLRYGQICNLRVVNGEPHYEPAPRVFCSYKFSGHDDRYAAPAENDYFLKRQMRELLEQLNQIESGTIISLDVQAGLPLRMVVEQGIGGQPRQVCSQEDGTAGDRRSVHDA